MVELKPEGEEVGTQAEGLGADSRDTPPLKDGPADWEQEGGDQLVSDMGRCKAGHAVPQDEDLVGEPLAGGHNGGGRGRRMSLEFMNGVR